MRFRALYHVAGVALFVLCLIYRLSGVISLIFGDLTPYELSEHELEADSHAHPNGSATQLIPKIIHQVYLGWDNKPIPLEWIRAQQSCLDVNPEFEYKLWTNESCRELLQTEYPWFLETWENYRYPIQRADSIRYFILAHYGGVYIDLDNGCLRNLSPLLSFPAWMPGTSNHMGLTNHVMGSVRNHPYFLTLTKSLQAYNINWLLPYLVIMNSAGPHFVSLVWHTYMGSRPRQDEVRILRQEEYAGHAWSFFTKEEGGSWNEWDTLVFKWIGLHIVLFSVLCFASICAVVSCVWWIVWRLTMRTGIKREAVKGLGPGLPFWHKSV